jgi:hypothetical protein
MFTRLDRAIAFGTERYPEKEARRLRAVNVAACGTAVVPITFGLLRATDPERWMFGLGTVSIGLAILATPLLHRFGSLAAPLALGLLVYAQIFRIVYTSGTSDGAYMTYLVAAGVAVLLVGLDHIRLAAIMAALAIGLMILLHTIVPPQTGLLAQQVPGRSGNFAVTQLPTRWSCSRWYSIRCARPPAPRRRSREKMRAQRHYSATSCRRAWPHASRTKR